VGETLCEGLYREKAEEARRQVLAESAPWASLSLHIRQACLVSILIDSGSFESREEYTPEAQAMLDRIDQALAEIRERHARQLRGWVEAQGAWLNAALLLDGEAFYTRAGQTIRPELFRAPVAGRRCGENGK
jgi:hypothetical protein